MNKESCFFLNENNLQRIYQIINPYFPCEEKKSVLFLVFLIKKVLTLHPILQKPKRISLVADIQCSNDLLIPELGSHYKVVISQ